MSIAASRPVLRQPSSLELWPLCRWLAAGLVAWVGVTVCWAQTVPPDNYLQVEDGRPVGALALMHGHTFMLTQDHPERPEFALGRWIQPDDGHLVLQADKPALWPEDSTPELLAERVLPHLVRPVRVWWAASPTWPAHGRIPQRGGLAWPGTEDRDDDGIAVLVDVWQVPELVMTGLLDDGERGVVARWSNGLETRHLANSAGRARVSRPEGAQWADARVVSVQVRSTRNAQDALAQLPPLTLARGTRHVVVQSVLPQAFETARVRVHQAPGQPLGLRFEPGTPGLARDLPFQQANP